MRPSALLSAFTAAVLAVAPVSVAAQDRLAPPPLGDKTNIWLLDLSTGGRVEIALRPDVAPKMVERIKLLTRQHFYDGLVFHRVIDGFMAQGGDPKGDGTGGSQLPDLPAEFNYLPHVRGSVAAARAEKEDSANSQFYIIFQPRFSLDKKYTVFGRVLSGMNYVDAIERGEPPANPSRVVHAYIASDNPPAYQPLPAAPPAALPTLPGTTPTLPATGIGSGPGAGSSVSPGTPAATTPTPAPRAKPAPRRR
jgi:cyclophilin family peptidyl-prolyl cis-trans isomerase